MTRVGAYPAVLAERQTGHENAGAEIRRFALPGRQGIQTRTRSSWHLQARDGPLLDTGWP